MTPEEQMLAQQLANYDQQAAHAAMPGNMRQQLRDQYEQQLRASAASGGMTPTGAVAGPGAPQNGSWATYQNGNGQTMAMGQSGVSGAEQEYKALLDPNSAASKAFYLGGDPNGFANEKNRVDALGRAVDARGVPVTNYNDANASRLVQANGVNMIANAAAGHGPSAAEGALYQYLQRAGQQQQQYAASARGGALSRSAAMRGAATFGGDLALQGAQGAAAIRSNEQLSAMGMLPGAASQMRGQDASMAQYLSDLELKNRQMNDARAMGYEQERYNLGNDSLNAATSAAAARRDNLRIQNGQEAAQNTANLQSQGQSMDLGGKVVGAGAGLVTGIAGFGFMAKGGGAAADAVQRSDENAKTDIKPGEKKLAEFLESLDAHDYVYKEPKRDGEGRHVSVMAQELEKSELGKKMVFEDEHGKLVDYSKGLPAMLAAIASMHKRVKTLEGEGPLTEKEAALAKALEAKEAA
jgi:hypothetical protein